MFVTRTRTYPDGRVETTQIRVVDKTKRIKEVSKTDEPKDTPKSKRKSVRKVTQTSSEA